MTMKRLNAGKHGVTADTPESIERKLADEILLQTGALQNAIFNSANFSSIATDAKGVIQIFNVGAERMLGYAATEVMNKITPADISDPQEVVARATALSLELDTPILPGFEALVFKASRGIEDIYELTYICKDGSRLPAVVSVTALRDAEETIIGYLLIGTDNTARKLADQARQASEARLDGIIASALDAIIAVDSSSRITLFNASAEKIFGFTSNEMLGSSLDRLIPERFRLAHQSQLDGFGETKLSNRTMGISGQIYGLRANGEEFPAEASISQLMVNEDKVFTVMLRDITERVKAEDALLKAGALQNAIFNSANFSSIATDAKGVIQIFNVGAERMLGYAAAEVMNKITPADISDPLELVARATALSTELNTAITPGFEALVFKASRGIEDVYELTYIRRDGSRFPAVVSVTALRDAEEAIIGYLLIGTEIKAGALQSAIFNSANFSSIATDAKGVIQIFNVGAERMLGYTAAEVMNKITPADISDPDEVITRAKALSVELETPITPGFEALVFKASRGIEDIYELTYIRKDGSRFPALVSVTALRDAQDAIIGYLLIGTDNTVRKLVEEEQKKSDQRLRDQQFYTRSLIESNIDALITTDPSGIITDVNKQMEALTGCTRDELIGAPFKKYFTDPARAEAAITRVLLEKSLTDYELTARARDGTKTVVSYNATTFYDRDRTLQGVFAAARDVTERKRVESELRHAKAAAESASLTKSDFLASMSHEIRTPMNAIMGIADLLANTPLNEEQDKYVQIFRRAGDNLLNLINDILDLSKVEASQLELERTGFSLVSHLEKVMEMVAAKAHEKGLVLLCTIAPNVPSEIVGDAMRLRQILLNLIGNAIKFTQTGQVSLYVDLDAPSDSPKVLRFAVTDTGIGIASRNLGPVFERFTQADSSMTRRFGGSGLGLTICKRLVELMGGRIWAESEIGKGSVFAFTTPLEIWDASSRPLATLLDAGLQVTLRPLRILLAEDSPDNCVIAMAYLEDTPYQVEVAETGAIACEMFKSGRYDLVLMDRQMPVMDGLTATRLIRAWEHEYDLKPVPIIALTASALKGDREMCLAAGCTDFLTKPIKQVVLLNSIIAHTSSDQSLSTGESYSPLVVPIKISPKLLALVPAYLLDCEKTVVALNDALDRSDFITTMFLAHNMSGSGGGFGHQAITDIGVALGRTAKSSDLQKSRRWVGELSTYLESIDRPPI